MPVLGDISRKRLQTCHPELIRVVEWGIKAAPDNLDFAVICGHRTEEEQEAAFRKGTSKRRWPHSKHNAFPSRAVDLAPYPINWEDEARFHELAGLILGVGGIIQIRVSWGGYWKSWQDRPHFELVDP